MAVQDLKARIDRAPEQPGVYIFSDGLGRTLYVGKARILRDRLRSYLAPAPANPKTDALVAEADRVEVIVTDSVVEALALENHLIKQRSPRYNVLLRDDKNYPYLRLSVTEAFPRVLVARRVERDGDVYAGPFLPAALARRTMSLLHKLFGLRSCNEVITGQRGRPCLEYDIKRCVAPCVAEICSPTEYGRAVADARLFLEGRNDELLADLRARMAEAAGAERFEQAAQLRDAVRTIETLRSRQQKMADVRLGDRDALGLKSGPAGSVVLVFQMRGGRVVDRVELVSDDAASASAREVIAAAVQQFYELHEPPPEIHVPEAIDEAEAVERWLSERAGRRVRLIVPRRGDKRGLLELATRNAAVTYESRFNDEGVARYEALDALRTILSLPAMPRRIECFDISTIQGQDTVAALVVSENGRLRRSEYRKFRIRGLARAATSGVPHESGADPADPRLLDDFAAMREVVLRRYRRVLDEGGPFADLVVVDGGPGQLASAYAALADIGLANLVAVGLAKREELIYTRDRREPLALPRSHPALLLLQQIRDEAHRVAVTFHRQRRGRRDLQSALDVIPGIGPRRRQALLRTFGSLAGVRRATREELVAAVGSRAADAVLAHFAVTRRD